MIDKIIGKIRPFFNVRLFYGICLFGSFVVSLHNFKDTQILPLDIAPFFQVL